MQAKMVVCGGCRNRRVEDWTCRICGVLFCSHLVVLRGEDWTAVCLSCYRRQSAKRFGLNERMSRDADTR